MSDARPGPRSMPRPDRRGTFASRAVLWTALVLGSYAAALVAGSACLARAEDGAPAAPPAAPPAPGGAPPDPAPAPDAKPPAPASPVADADADERAEQIDRQTTKGLTAFNRGNHDEALTRMERLASSTPRTRSPKYLKARVLARTGKYEEALALSTEAAAAHPDDRGVEALRFDLFRRLGRDEDAAKAAEEALAKRPDDLVALTTKGLLLEAVGKRPAALAAYDAVVEAYNAKDPRPEELSCGRDRGAARDAPLDEPGRRHDEGRAARAQGAHREGARRRRRPPRLRRRLPEQARQGEPVGRGQVLRAAARRQLRGRRGPVGQARIAQLFYNQAGAIRQCSQRALTTNPASCPP